MENKVLIGVEHKSEEEIDRVNNEISLLSPSKVGIELPEDYQHREMYGIKTFFFSDIASHLRDAGVEVVPLENPDIWNRHHAIELAMAVIKSQVKREDVEMELARIEMTGRKDLSYTAPETLYHLEYFGDKYRTALGMLDRTQSLEGMQELWRDSNKKREVYVLGKIKVCEPDAVVIGDGHARELKEHLPEYEYVTITSS